jgi:hypothetical protein
MFATENGMEASFCELPYLLKYGLIHNDVYNIGIRYHSLKYVECNTKSVCYRLLQA